MELRLNNLGILEVVPSFLALLKYRAEHGTSFLSDFTNEKSIIKLIYISIASDKPNYSVFEAACVHDKSFKMFSSRFLKELIIKDKPEINQSDSVSDAIDEFKTLALAATAQIPFEILGFVNIYQLTAIIGHYCDIKNGNGQVHEMDSQERKMLYNITPEKEKQIELALMQDRSAKNGK